MKNISKDINTGEFKKVYLIYGEEDYLKNNIKKRLTSAITGDETTMNYNRFEGKDIKISEITGIADTFPFFADRRMILIENSGFFKSSNDELTVYLDNMPDTTIMVFIEDEVDKRGKLYKKVKETGYVCEATHMSEGELEKWLLQIIGKNNKQITKDTLSMILQYTGTDMLNIANEMEKLLNYTLDKGVITNEDVEAVCTPQISGKIFDMIDAIGNKNSKKALELYRNLLAIKEPPMRILFMLSRQFNIMLKVKELNGKGYSKDNIAKNVGVQSFVVTKALKQSESFGGKELVEALNDCLEAETDVKNGRLDELAAVEMIIVKYSEK